MKLVNVTAIGVVTAALFASPGFAQSPGPGTAVSFAAGAATDSSTAGATLGGSLLVDLSDHLSLEGQGTYLDRGRGSDALSVGGSLLVNLLSSRERIVPYAALGGGVYRASFDLADSRFMGFGQAPFAPGNMVCPAPGFGMGSGPGAGFGPGTGTCPANVSGYWGVGQMGGFYARRLGPMTVPGGGAWETRSFTDPALSLGGGVRFNVTERLMVRPDVRAITVFADGDTHTIAVFGLNVGFRF